MTKYSEKQKRRSWKSEALNNKQPLCDALSEQCREFPKARSNLSSMREGEEIAARRLTVPSQLHGSHCAFQWWTEIRSKSIPCVTKQE